MSSATPRLRKELKDVTEKCADGISAGLSGDNLFDWDATIMGPPGTPYEGGVFSLKVRFPNNYPYQPPDIIFTTRIYHCNINAKGVICLDILKDNWSPAYTIDKVLLSISALMASPNPNDPLVPEIAKLYNINKNKHDDNAREYTLKFAILQ